MHEPPEHDPPPTAEELLLARDAAALISAAVQEIQAPLSLHEEIERGCERALTWLGDRAHRHRLQRPLRSRR